MRAKSTLILVVFIQLLSADLTHGQSAKVTGSWNVEITFNNGPARLLRFEAQDSGKGNFLVLNPSMKVWGPAKPSEAKWTQADDLLTFSGPVEFPLGNVGRDAGILMLKGKFEADGTITGKATFGPTDQDQKDPETKPTKEGIFRATRGPGG